MPERRLARAWGAAVASLLLAATAASTSKVISASQTRMVVIDNMQFTPQSLIVKPGERIAWVNKDPFPHTATADAKAFDSQAIAPNASWTWVAGTPGTYTYACSFHPAMKATLTVQ